MWSIENIFACHCSNTNLVSLRDPVLSCLGSGRQRCHKIDGSIFALPVLRGVGVELGQHALDVLSKDGRDLRLEVTRQSFDQITGGPATSVYVGSFLEIQIEFANILSPIQTQNYRRIIAYNNN